jgi:signal transduction histidine kinase
MVYTPYVWLTIFAGVILGGCALYLRRFQHVAGVRPCIALMWLAASWALLTTLSMSTKSLHFRILFLNMQFVPAAFTSVTALVFAIEISGRGRWLTRSRLLLLASVPLLAVVLQWTGQWHTLFRYNYRMDLSGPVPVLLTDKGPAYWMYLAFAFLLFLCAYWLLFSLLSIRTTHLRSALIMFGLLTPFIIELLYNLGITPIRGYDLAPAVGGITAIFGIAAFYQLRIFDVKPVARTLVMDNIADLVLVLDGQGRIVDANRAAQITYHLPGNFVGQTLSVLPQDWADMFRRYDRVSVVQAEVSLGAGEHMRFYELTIAPIVDELQRVLGRLFLLHDITARKQVDVERERLLQAEAQARREAERANEMSLNFLAMISHELRTPLTSIKGFASTLLANDVTWDEASQRDFLKTIDQEADNLTDLIDQLLDMSRIQSGVMHVTPQRISLQDIVSAAMPQLEALAYKHDLRIAVPDTLPALWVDRQRIVQVLTNLVSNAAKYSPARTAIRLVAELADAFVMVCVSDEGSGIAPSDQPNVFQPFRRGSDERVQRVKGAGLGLAICKGLVEAHGGRIWLQEHTGPGTTVCFTLPVAA